MGEPVFCGTAMNFVAHYCNLSFDNVFVDGRSINLHYVRTIFEYKSYIAGTVIYKLINGLIILAQKIINQYLISYFTTILIDN